MRLPKLTTLPAQIGSLVHLSVLSLKNCDLSSLPSCAIIVVCLMFCCFDSIHFSFRSRVPIVELGQCVALKTLLLNNNQLTKLPAALGNVTRHRSIFNSFAICLMIECVWTNRQIEQVGTSRSEQQSTYGIGTGTVCACVSVCSFRSHAWRQERYKRCVFRGSIFLASVDLCADESRHSSVHEQRYHVARRL